MIANCKSPCNYVIVIVVILRGRGVRIVQITAKITLGGQNILYSSFWDSQKGRVRTTSILVGAFWNFKLMVLKYSRNCISQYILVAEVWHPLYYVLFFFRSPFRRTFESIGMQMLWLWKILWLCRSVKHSFAISAFTRSFIRYHSYIT